MASVIWDNHIAGWVAIAVLGISLVLRLLARRREREKPSEEGL